MADPTSHNAALLQAALDLPPTERVAFIERECAADAVLLARMRALLAIDAQEWTLLDQPIDALAADVIASNIAGDDHAGSRTDQCIGPFRLVRELGRGGMGSVWLAERADGQFAQRVALKLIKLGMDSAHVQSQFRRERAVLARLQHPNIAQLIDGGMDERGRPWFAMELVEGVGLRAWVEQRQPDLRQRLQLFAKLCRAVAHAHQQLVVHRDLKPSNVLVQADDEPRLLDFGIAKLLESDDAEQTATVHRFLSRDFAAPEQIRGEAVSTATDVYALGLLLFELLTSNRYRSVHKDGAATLRPSFAPANTTTTSAHISRAQLRGDLDAITLRALADDAARRYPGAQALADDVQRHLDGKPVEARPDGFGYRAAKFVRRNRAVVGVATLGLIALFIASGGAFWQAHAKAQEAERARVALKRSEAIRDFVESMFLGADPWRGKGVDTTAGELLQSARDRVARDLGNEPEVAASLLDQIGNTYVSIGEDGLARQAMLQAMAFNAKTTRPSMQIEGSAGARLAYYTFREGNSQQALADLDRIAAKLRGGGSKVSAQLAKTLEFRGSVLYALDRREESLDAQREAVALRERTHDENPSEYLIALIGYSDLAAALDHGDEALAAAEHALADPLLQSADAPVGLKYAALGVKARALQAQGRHADAEPLMVEVIAGQTALYGADTARTRYWRFRHGEVLYALGRLEEAHVVIDTLLALPTDGAAPYVHARTQVVGAAIAIARKTADAATRVEEAVIAACGKDGKADLCATARALEQAGP